jgi:hypothetical protein
MYHLLARRVAVNDPFILRAGFPHNFGVQLQHQVRNLRTAQHLRQVTTVEPVTNNHDVVAEVRLPGSEPCDGWLKH